MIWKKQGDPIFVPDHQYDWMVSHAALPVVDPIGDERLRIYFGARDAQGRSRPACVDVDAAEPRRILHLHDRPILALGRLGTFDDDGIMPSWIVTRGRRKYLYYIGWNRQVTVPYRLSVGLAISHDGGETYARWSDGPICDRSVDEPYFCTTPCVLRDGDVWRMWYTSCTKWEVVNERPEPFYHVKYADSEDGVHWRRSGRVCIDYDDFTQGVARPSVLRHEGVYKMFYSYRSATDYRTDRRQSYRLGYAESTDGLTWTRRDDEVGIERSAHGWDSEMMEYGYVYEHRGRIYMVYNGNGFGRSGFGYAVREESAGGV